MSQKLHRRSIWIKQVTARAASRLHSAVTEKSPRARDEYFHMAQIRPPILIKTHRVADLIYEARDWVNNPDFHVDRRIHYRDGFFDDTFSREVSQTIQDLQLEVPWQFDTQISQ
jgi:hypothetical protein